MAGLEEQSSSTQGVIGPRRKILRALGATLALAAVGGAGAVLLRRRSRETEAAEGAALAEEAYSALRTGNTAGALKLAAQARKLAPDSRAAAQAWLHATGLDLLEGDGGDGAAHRAIGFLDETRVLGAKGLDLGFAVLVSAVVLKNDKLARRVLEQHEADALETDAFYELAAGAALDLDCDPVAEERFRRSAARWVDALLPRLRRARSLAFAGRYAEAGEELENVAGPAAKVMTDVIAALEKPRATHAYVDPFAITDLPRSLRPLAQALTVSADNAQSGLDAAMSDIDCPLVALACSDIAAGALDFASAERAAQAALDMRSELSAASERIVRVRLRRGDLEQAIEAAKSSGDANALSLVAAIDAYEQGRADLLKQAVEDAGAGRGWTLAGAARGLLDGTTKPTLEELAMSLQTGEPWADVVAVDVAIDAGRLDDAKKITQGWADSSPPRDKRKKRLSEREKEKKAP